MTCRVKRKSSLAGYRAKESVVAALTLFFLSIATCPFGRPGRAGLRYRTWYPESLHRIPSELSWDGLVELDSCFCPDLSCLEDCPGQQRTPSKMDEHIHGSQPIQNVSFFSPAGLDHRLPLCMWRGNRMGYPWKGGPGPPSPSGKLVPHVAPSNRHNQLIAWIPKPKWQTLGHPMCRFCQFHPFFRTIKPPWRWLEKWCIGADRFNSSIFLSRLLMLISSSSNANGQRSLFWHRFCMMSHCPALRVVLWNAVHIEPTGSVFPLFHGIESTVGIHSLSSFAEKIAKTGWIEWVLFLCRNW